MRVCAALADSATETPETLDPNQVKGGTAPSKTVQLPDFTATDHTGSEFTLEQIKVWCCTVKESSLMPCLLALAVAVRAPCHPP